MSDERKPTVEKAVIDRVVDGRLAVLIIGDAAREEVVPVEALPPGATDGTWLQIRVDGNTIVDIEIDAIETERAKSRIRSKMERLRRRGR